MNDNVAAAAATISQPVVSQSIRQKIEAILLQQQVASLRYLLMLKCDRELISG